MISVNQSLFTEGQTVFVRECDLTSIQLDDIINRTGINNKLKESSKQVKASSTKANGKDNFFNNNEPSKSEENLSMTHLQNKTNLDNSKMAIKPMCKLQADGSENKYINVVVLEKKKKFPEKKEKEDKQSGSSHTAALCSKCGKNFSSNYNLKRHMTSCKLCPEEEKGPRYKCSCGRSYSQEWDLKKHKLSCHKNLKKGKNCLFPFCNLIFYHKSQLLAHMKATHNINIQDPEVYEFETIDDFKEWKERLEESTYTYYSKQTGSNVTGVSVNTYYVCQHDGSDRAHTSTPRKTARRNKKGRVKTGRFCWSQMNVKQFRDGSIRVTYYPSHTHPITAADTEHHPLPSSIKTEITRRLSELKQECDESIAIDYTDLKKARKKNYAMNARTLRALARKNRKLFRITAEAIEGAEDGKGIEPQESLLKKTILDESGDILLVPVDDEQEMNSLDDPPPLKREHLIDSCNTHIILLQELMSSGKLSDNLLNQVKATLEELVQGCRTEMVESEEKMEEEPSTSLDDLGENIYEKRDSADEQTVFPLGEEATAALGLRPDENAVYQVVTLNTKEDSSSRSDEAMYQNAVELSVPREFLLISNDTAQIFQSISSNQLTLHSSSLPSQIWSSTR